MRKRVLLCGNSLLISGLHASLKLAPRVDSRQVEPLPDLIRERIESWRPQVVILETRQLSEGISLGLLLDFPSLKLIGLDIKDSRLLALSGSIAEIPTTEVLLKMIAQ